MKGFVFCFKRKYNNKKRLEIIGSSWRQILHKPNPAPRTLCWTYFLKTSFSLAYHISFRFQWVCSSSNHTYSHGWFLLESLKNETLLSQGLLDYSHVSQSLSNFTCSNIKTSCLNPSLSLLKTSLFSFIFFMMFLNIVNSDLQNTLGIL